jgi:hypothetical protein
LSAKIIGTITRLCIAGIMLGILGMIQPFVFDLFRYSFLLLLFSTLAFIIVSHLPEPSSASANPDVLQELPIGLSSSESSVDNRNSPA